MNVLDQIAASKCREVEERKFRRPVHELEKMSFFKRPATSLREALQKKAGAGIVAEFKRRSPSKGLINAMAGVKEVVTAYEKGGACGISVLTDAPYFGGSLEDLMVARECSACPLLRKDFIIDEYQIIEARSHGADVVLLIASLLSFSQIKQFSSVARSLGMEVLLELHEEKELEKIPDGISMVGVNNRNLKTFHVSVEQSVLLAGKIPSGMIKIAESGISSPAVISELFSHGYKGFLIGECFMRESNPGEAFEKFINELHQKGL